MVVVSIRLGTLPSRVTKSESNQALDAAEPFMRPTTGIESHTMYAEKLKINHLSRAGTGRAIGSKYLLSEQASTGGFYPVEPPASSLTKSAARSATAYTKLARFPLTCNGKTLASTTLKFLVPWTFNLSSTTLPSCLGPMAHVPIG